MAGGEEQYGDWCHIELPGIEEELVARMSSSEEMANLCASCINKHIHHYTDTRMTAAVMDQVFCMLQYVGTHRKEMLKIFLHEMARENQDGRESDMGRMYHKAIIGLLVEIIKQFLDPVTNVILCLKLLRSLSHVPSNISSFIACHSTATILGSMAAYLSNEEVQQHSTDILCKIATYTPIVGEKAPLRETAMELIIRAMKHHGSSLHVTQSACRTVASLAIMLFEQANQIMESKHITQTAYVQNVEKSVQLLEYVHQNVTEVIHGAMKTFPSDLCVTMESRRFLFIMAKLEHLRKKQQLWLEGRANAKIPESSESTNEGILKKSRSFENLRSNERKVSFIEEGGPGVYDSSSSDSEVDSEKHGASLMDTDDAVINSHTQNPLSGTASTTKDISDVLNQDKTCPREQNKTEVHQNDDRTRNASKSKGTISVVNEQNERYSGSMSLLSELGQVDPGLTLTIDSSVRGQFGGPDGGFSEEEEEEELGELDYNSADIEYLNRLVKTQIVCRVCSLAFTDEDKEAYTSVERPIQDVLRKDKMPPKLLQFFQSQYKPELTMMDFDPGTVISLIDAIRYKSQVAPGVVQMSLLGLIKNINSRVNPRHLRLSVAILNRILEEPALMLTVSDASFHGHFRVQLEESCKCLPEPCIFASVLAKVTPGHSLMDLDCY